MSLQYLKYSAFLIFCITGTFICHDVFPANDNYPAGTRFSAMGNIGVACPDLWSVSHNQAGLGFYNHLSVGFHHENKFAISEFSLNSVAFTLPTSTGTFGLSYTYFGYSSYHESKIGIGFGKSLNRWFSAGLQLNYLNTYVADETGNLNGMTIEAGIIAKPLQNLSIGFHIYNPTVSSFTGLSENERIPVIINLGVGYEYGEKLYLGIETLKDLEMAQVSLKAGIEYKLIEHIYIRTGVIISELISHSFGLGFVMKKIRADIAFSHQQIIGYTPHFSVQYNFR
jgi:hypothetical protein